jgi:hypothetical protein
MGERLFVGRGGQSVFGHRRHIDAAAPEAVGQHHMTILIQGRELASDLALGSFLALSESGCFDRQPKKRRWGKRGQVREKGSGTVSRDECWKRGQEPFPGIRVREKVSGTGSELGRQARDTFASLKKTCRELGVNCWAYLQDRVRGVGQIPRMAELIRRKAEETAARKAVAALPA